MTGPHSSTKKLNQLDMYSLRSTRDLNKLGKAATRTKRTVTSRLFLCGLWQTIESALSTCTVTELSSIPEHENGTATIARMSSDDSTVVELGHEVSDNRTLI